MTRRDRLTARAVVRVLIRARARLADPRRWMRNGLATAGGAGHRVACPPAHPAAVRWCALGAVEAETSTAWFDAHGGVHIRVDRPLGEAALRRLEAAGGAVVRTNDRKGHAAVLALFDAALRGK